MKSTIGAVLLLAVPAVAQERTPIDPATAERALAKIFERPPRTPISDEAKAALGEFIAANEGRLGRVGYAVAIHKYLTRDYDGAAAALDRFFEDYDRIENPEHSMMAGRIYLNAFSRGARGNAPNLDALSRFAGRTAKLYPDADLLERALPNMIGRLGNQQDRTVVRLAFARGVLGSELAPATQLRVLRVLLGDGDQRPRPAAPARRAGQTEAARQATAIRDGLTGKPAPALDIRHVLNGAKDFTLESARGKTVVIDFWATWCGPCIRVIPGLIELQKERDDLQVVGVTRFYGYGTDYAGGPTRGQQVRDLDQATEVELNETFVAAFDVNYPIVIAGPDTARMHYGVTGIPTVFVVGPDGEVKGHVVGASDAAHAKLLELLK